MAMREICKQANSMTMSLQAAISTVHFVETTQSVLREMPWIRLEKLEVSASQCEQYS